MRPSSGRQTCDCCDDFGDREFQKILELKDAGVSIYRYCPQIQDEAQIGSETGEVFILRNTGAEDLKIEELPVESGKKAISCPRCIKMFERATRLFKNLPPAKIREVTGICEHCYQKDFFHCPCCDKIVDKFLKLRFEEENKREEYRQRNKSWITKTQLAFKKSVPHIKDGKLEPSTRLAGRIQESEAPISRYVPTTKRVQEPGSPKIYAEPKLKSESVLMREQYQLVEEYLDKPLKVLSFLDFSDEEKLRPKEKKDIEIEKIKRLAEETTDKSLKSVSFHILPGRDLETTLSPVIEEDIQFTALMETDIQSQQNEEQDITTTPMIKKDKRPKLKVEQDSQATPLKDTDMKAKPMKEKEIKRTVPTEKDIKYKPSIEQDIKPKPIFKKKGIMKPREYGVLGDDTTPRERRKRSVSPTQQSFETIMKSLSEPNVSTFSYSFPQDKAKIKKPVKGRVSSLELIKNTQDMLEERQETARKEKQEREEERKKREEEKKLRTAEKKRRAEEVKRKQEEEERNKEIGKLTGEEAEQVTKRKKHGDVDEKETAAVMAALQKGLTQQAKELSEEEKMRKQREKDTASGEKKATLTLRDAEKAIGDTRQRLTTDKQTKHPEAKSDIERGAEKGDKDKDQKDLEKSKAAKEREDKLLDAGAQTALKEQVAKQAKEQSEEEKLKKQQVMELGERKAQEAAKAIEATQKELTSEKKTKPKSVTDAISGDKDNKDKGVKDKGDKDKGDKDKGDKDKGDKDKGDKDKGDKDKGDKDKGDKDKGDKDKGEKGDKTAKEEKTKGGKSDEMAALLREQLAKQKQLELEKEKLKKQQEKEKELAEKKLKELENKKEAERSKIKPPVLESEDQGSVDEPITEVIIKPEEVTDVIRGQKIYKVKSAKKTDDKTQILESKQSKKSKEHSDQITAKQESELNAKSEALPKPPQGFVDHKPGQTTPTQTQQKLPTPGDKKSKPNDAEVSKGVIRYTLSDRTFIDKGWTMLPTEKVVRKMNVYRMRPAKPEFDWFEHNKNKGEMMYDTGEKLADFDDNGRGRWYYRTGDIALDYYDAEETNAGQRFVVYSTGLPDERGRSRPRTLLATFDYSGNGIVFDHTGKIRLKFNQTEGVVLDRNIGPVSHWKWHTLNDPPVLQQVMIDTQMPYKDPTILSMGDKHADAKRPDNEEMLAIEFENFLKEKRQKLTQSFKPFQIRMKAMKINEYFSLRVLDQASIYLLFRDGTTNLKLNIGMLLDHKEIVDTDTAEIGEVSNTLDKLPACTDSIAGLQKAVAKAHAQERFRVRHELRLKPPEKIASVDALHAGCSRPPRTPIVQASLSSCDKMTPKRFKPSSCNLYYSTQLF